MVADKTSITAATTSAITKRGLSGRYITDQIRLAICIFPLRHHQKDNPLSLRYHSCFLSPGWRYASMSVSLTTPCWFLLPRDRHILCVGLASICQSVHKVIHKQACVLNAEATIHLTSSRLASQLNKAHSISIPLFPALFSTDFPNCQQPN